MSKRDGSESLSAPKQKRRKTLASGDSDSSEDETEQVSTQSMVEVGVFTIIQTLFLNFILKCLFNVKFLSSFYWSLFRAEPFKFLAKILSIISPAQHFKKKSVFKQICQLMKTLLHNSTLLYFKTKYHFAIKVLF